MKEETCLFSKKEPMMTWEMKSVVALLLLSFFHHCTSAVVKAECGPNEIFQNEGYDCATCDNYKVVRCALVHEPGCFCEPNYVRNRNGRCTATADCPRRRRPVRQPHGLCPQNQTFQAEGGFDCQTCETVRKGIQVKCALNPEKKCYCDPGYVRSDGGLCVLTQDCRLEQSAPPPPTCGDNEEPALASGNGPRSCQEPCPPTCSDPRRDDCRSLIYVCKAGCNCQPGFVRREENGPCVKPESCPGGAAGLCRGAHREYRTCGSLCEPTCSGAEGRACPAVCVAGCFCRRPFVVDAAGHCVQQEDCDAVKRSNSTI